MDRIRFICMLVGVFVIVDGAWAGEQAKKPNVILIIADDMGHGDLGFHGNPKIRTPNLDRLAKESVRFKYFYVCPVCSPTRASLMTGRYNYRTGVVDTFIGRSMMHPDEVTIAERLAAGGYQCGIFGKWHLGDCYPMRAMDQGFHEALVHRGGGIGQPSDPPGGSSYFDSILQHNGVEARTKGYCSDVYTDAAMDFIAKNKERPFFVYLPFNAPHAPLELPDSYYNMYKNMDLSHDQFPKLGHPLPGKALQDVTARVYGMVTNIDDNLGRLFKKLDELGLTDNTIVIFLTDNGPQQVRYNSGMLMRKGNVHEGGVRVPFFVRWPAVLKGNRDVTTIAAHIDVTPTLLAACGIAPAKNLDGLDLLPLMKGENIDWPDRTLYTQWHRGDVPELYRAFAARSQNWRLVQPEGSGPKALPKKYRFKLYDMAKDPLEEHDVADKHPEIVAKMKKGYEDWFKDVSSTRGYDPPRIHVGTPHEERTVLTRQDWRSPGGWSNEDVGHWEIHVADPGRYLVYTSFNPTPQEGKVYLTIGRKTQTGPAPASKVRNTVVFAVDLRVGPTRVETWLTQGNSRIGAAMVEIKKSE